LKDLDKDDDGLFSLPISETLLFLLSEMGSLKDGRRGRNES
jgi:hypothetical protein